MGYIYRYIDLEDNIVKYVGIVWSNRRKLQERYLEHILLDDWCKTKKFRVEYLEEDITTRTDAELFESKKGTFPDACIVQTNTERSEVGGYTPLLRSRRQVPLGT